MKVIDLIKKLQEMPHDADVYYGSFSGFLTDDLQPARPAITDKESHEVYPVSCEFKTVYNWSIRKNRYVPYTGVIFEIDG